MKIPSTTVCWYLQELWSVTHIWYLYWLKISCEENQRERNEDITLELKAGKGSLRLLGNIDLRQATTATEI